MIQIQFSVGKNGQNLASDVRKIQCLLFQLGFLPRTAFVLECLEQTLLKPTQSLKEEILDHPAPMSINMLGFVNGDFKLDTSLIPLTLEAIVQFQIQKVGLRNPDGRIDVKGRTIRKLLSLFDSLQKTRGIAGKSYLLKTEGDQIKIELFGPSKSITRIYSANRTRQYILSRYNWNGTLKLLRKVFQLFGKQYLTPTNITGNAGDDALILPDEALALIIEAQLRHSLQQAPPTDENLDEILRKVDGLPGPGFAAEILQEKDLNQFLSEHSNQTLQNILDPSEMKIPGISSSQQEWYNFFKNLTLARNGLWSDQPGIVNLTGLRRVIDAKSSTGYNDTLAVCYLTENDQGTWEPRVELHIASTEPGNRVIDRQLVPQTMTVVAGYHHARQPAGRTRNAIKQERNNGSLTWQSGDTTMNFHQGANNFRYPGDNSAQQRFWLAQYGIDGYFKLGNPKPGADIKVQMDLNRTLSEIYLILSKYGLDGQLPPYQNLGELAKKEVAWIIDDLGETISVSHPTDPRPGTKEIPVATAKKWILTYWAGQKSQSSRRDFAVILEFLEILPKSEAYRWFELPRETIQQAISANHILQVVRTQAQYLHSLDDIDGKAGKTFAKIAKGLYNPFNQIQSDWNRLQTLIDMLDHFPLKNRNAFKDAFKNHFLIHTEKNRARYFENVNKEPRTQMTVVQNASVGPYSQGCQVIFDTEKFYTFWFNLLDRANQHGQTRWYYTLVDATNWEPHPI